jgi:hypothetical protein
MNGVLALVAFLMSNFIPAILAPLVVLVGFVFATLELGRGSKLFGGIVFFCARCKHGLSRTIFQVSADRWELQLRMR